MKTTSRSNRLTNATAVRLLLGRFLVVLILLSSCVLTSASFADDLVVLPPTSDKKAEPIPHFPSRIAAFVWRSWNLAPIDAMARTLGTTPEHVHRVADILGLPGYQGATWDSERVYITLLRRNWSILPYEQLLTLLELTPEELAKKLREDDFLSVKLGAKPYCEPLRFEEPTASDWVEMRRIALEVREVLGDDFELMDGESRFEFLKEFESDESTEESSDVPESTKSSQFEICYLHSYFALFGDPLLQDSSKIYPNGLLKKLADRGVNGVWLHALLRDLTPATEDFPEFGEDSEIRRANLRDLVARAKKYGIDVYLYMNEPRAMPATFFENHAEEKGVTEGAYCAMCASSPKVRRWLSDSLAYLFADVPGLGGIFTITGSENLTSCVSHGGQAGCPRCSKRSDVDLIVDLNAAMEEGVHRSAPDAKVIVWDWGWRGHGLATDIVKALPKNVWLQSVSEWAIPINRGDVHVSIGEYSISVVGPGPRAKEHWAAAKSVGLKTIAKCQFNSTWEIASIPSIPALELVARHAQNLSGAGVDGVMAGWSLGGFPSINLEVVHEFAVDSNATVDSVLDKLARQYFGDEGKKLARDGWRVVSEAFENFPYGGSVVYCAPNQIGAANLLRLEPTGWPASMVGIPYDALDAWRGPYPPETFASQMEKTGRGFIDGAKLLKEAAEFAPQERRVDAERQGRYAEFAGVVYLSVANQTRFVVLRDERIKLLAQSELSVEQKARLAELEAQMIAIARDEIDLAKKQLYATQEDSRIGFESTNQYWFVPIDLVEKIVSCLEIIRTLETK